jgi:Caspase domain
MVKSVFLSFFILSSYWGYSQENKVINNSSNQSGTVNLVLPFKFDYYFERAVFSDNGRFALLTGMTSTNMSSSGPVSLLLNLELKRIIRQIPDSKLHLSNIDDHQLREEYMNLNLSNNGTMLAAKNINKNEIHLISLLEYQHRVINFSDDEMDYYCSVQFNQNDSILYYNNGSGATYSINTHTGTIIDTLIMENEISQIGVWGSYFYQVEYDNGQTIIKKYSQKGLNEIKPLNGNISQEGRWDGRCRSIFSNGYCIQELVQAEKEEFLVSYVELQSNLNKYIKIPWKKIDKNLEEITLGDAVVDTNKHLLYFMTYSELTSKSSVDDRCDLWTYNISTENLEKNEEFRFTNAFSDCNEYGMTLTPKGNLFFLNEGSFYSNEVYESIPVWLEPSKKTIKLGYGDDFLQPTWSVHQNGSKTLFETSVYGVSEHNMIYTEIDLSNGQLMSFNKLNKGFGDVESEYLGYDLELSFNDTTESSEVHQRFYPNDTNDITAYIGIQNDHRFILRNESTNSFDFFNSKLDPTLSKVTVALTLAGEYIFYSDDRYYLISSKAANFLYFEKDLEIFPFEQFDLKYNRPDIILDRLGYADSALVDAYHSAYQKRLKKMGFTEDMLQDDFHLPEIKIENFEEMPTLHDQGSIDLKLKLEDSKYKLDRINVWVNDVAVYGSDGISLRDKDVQDYSTTLKVDLAKGNNKVQVSVLNQAGAESYKETFEIECTAGKNDPDLYLITIGESEFEQSDFNLTYAAKDAKDIAALFDKSKAYGEVKTKTLVNQEVTKENVLALKSFLAEADINDEVMIFIAGHGVLDANLDYYFATYDMDFMNPADKGLAYEDLESLLDGIKPLKKTLMIDACHSGEIDKDEVELAEVDAQEDGDVQFRAVGKTASPKLGMQNTSELTKSLFTDLRKGTGATVISSAGGMEFAMEGDDWSNGLFTYCFIKGIQSKAADYDNNGEIWLSEIKRYVSEHVTELSNGKQQPTSRIENQVIDFRLW